MRVRESLIGAAMSFALLFSFVSLCATRAAAQTESVLLNFTTADGLNPRAGLIFDPEGRLYGTTSYGGLYGGNSEFGTVFQLVPAKDGSWTENVLHIFGGPLDGSYPVASVTRDPSGNIYGTTQNGGKYKEGVVFELSQSPGGEWSEKVLHDFNYSGGKDGASPTSGLVLDAAGNLYGTTSSGGTGGCRNAIAEVGCGTVFILSPQTDGNWREKILFNIPTPFHSYGSGAFPSGLVFDSFGSLYGMTEFYGTRAGGTVFKLSPDGTSWKTSVIYNFVRDGAGPWWPLGDLTIDSVGNLYGTTMEGGGYSDGYYAGTVFELSPGIDGVWTEKTLHNFDGSTGFDPASGVILDASGNLYGTTFAGGDQCLPIAGCGTVFKLSPNDDGNWDETILYSFNDVDNNDGEFPFAAPVLDSSGRLYGTTWEGGSIQSGTVYEITP